MNNLIISANNISFGYKKYPLIIDSWSQKFYQNEIVAITGPSGVGKSTLLYLLGLMLCPTSGSIVIERNEINYASDKLMAEARAELFGFVFQDAHLNMSRSIIDNVTESCLYRHVDPRDYEDRAVFLLEKFGVAQHPYSKPSQISGGQAQRVGLCRALLNSPKILLADEPTGNLDIESSKVVFDALKDHAHSGGTVIIITHDMTIANACDRILSIN